MGLRGVLIVVLLCILFIPSCREQALDVAGQAAGQVAAAAGQVIGQAIEGLVSGMVRSVTDGVKGVADDVGNAVSDAIPDALKGGAPAPANPSDVERMDEVALQALAKARLYTKCSSELGRKWYQLIDGPYTSEFGGLIYRRDNGSFAYNGPFPGRAKYFEAGPAEADLLAMGVPRTAIVAQYHSHPPTGYAHFSTGDLCAYINTRTVGYVIGTNTPGGDGEARRFVANGKKFSSGVGIGGNSDETIRSVREFLLDQSAMEVGSVTGLGDVPGDAGATCPATSALVNTSTPLTAEKIKEMTTATVASCVEP